MKIEVLEEPTNRIAELARIPIAFRVESLLTVEGRELVERAVAEPWVKDYDTAGGNRPEDWAAEFDTSNWGLLAAAVSGERVGGALIAWKTDGKQIFAACRDGRLRVIDPDTVEVKHNLPAVSGWAYSVAVHPKNHELLVGGERGQLKRVKIPPLTE